MVRRHFTNGIDKPPFLSPGKIRQAGTGEQKSWSAALEIAAFQYLCGLAILESVFSINDALAVPEPRGLKQMVAGLALNQQPRLPAIGAHQPDVLRDRVAKSDLRTVWRERCVMGIVAQFLQRRANH